MPSRRKLSRSAFAFSAGAMVCSVLALILASGGESTAPAARAMATPAAPAAQVVTRDPDLAKKLAKLESEVARLSAAFTHLKAERDALLSHLTTEVTHHRRVRIERLDEATTLLPPKLMLSVHRFGRGEASFCIGPLNRRLLRVGQLLELEGAHAGCWLVLEEADGSGATFVFGCDGDRGAG